ncbi:hypothetical protein [Halosimplex halophilum]|uniref:hypothetical protein n=1 Tax=Halosimplex halophilum TaxID=2559572 RepID=UPI00107F87F7|nr:hypothetical protein [Halosimplex halophilum]
MPSRRDVLGSVAGSAALSGTAGCLSTGPSDPILGCVSVTNDAAQARTVHVIVERADELVAWDTLELAGHDESGVARKWIERTWPAEPAPFLIRARVEGRDGWEQVDSEGLANGNYIHYDLEVGEESTIFWKNSVPDPNEQCAGTPVATGTPETTD